jgi:hypothetical protein
MLDVTGAFKPDVPRERQKALLAEFSRRSGVRAAGLIKEDAKSAELRLLFFVRVDEDQAVSVVEDLQRHSEIEVAQVEPRRRLT